LKAKGKKALLDKAKDEANKSSLEAQKAIKKAV
jgi:hypothetical protein